MFTCLTLLTNRTYSTGLLEVCINSVNVHCTSKDLKVTFVCRICEGKVKLGDFGNYRGIPILSDLDF